MKFKATKNLKDLFSKYGVSAKDIISDKEKGMDFFERAENLLYYLNIAAQLGENLERALDAIHLCRDYLAGTYQRAPVSSILAIVGALGYCVLPADMIPDFVPFIGYLDDFAVLDFVIRAVDFDIINWKNDRQRQVVC